MNPGPSDPAYWRSTDPHGAPTDLRFLDEASRSLLGYRVHLAYRQFLGVIIANFNRWYSGKVILNLREPAWPQGVAFDFGAIDLDALTRILGVYLYIYSCHKGANDRLMHRFDGKQVLYLRGYEAAVTVDLEGDLAAEASSAETLRFNDIVEKLVTPDVCVFKVLAPEEVHWDTQALERRILEGDIDAIAQRAMHPFRSVFLNARHWQQGVLDVLDHMDHYLVWVSSMTPSAMWELEQLDSDARRDRVTVVFDAEAISRRSGILGYQGGLLNQGFTFIWQKDTPRPTSTPEELHAWLAARFHVVTLDGFVADLGTHRERIASTSSPLAPGEREMSLAFQFHPAIADAPLIDLRDYSAWLKARIDTAVGQQDVVCGPLFLNDIQLRIFSTLLLGEHDETGRALAAYAGMLRAVLAAYSRVPELRIWQSPFPPGRNIALLEEHIQVARHWGISLMACGPTDHFASIFEQAKAEFLEREASATTAVEHLLRRWPIDRE